MAKKAKTISVEEKLRSLYDLQLIDMRIDEIRSTRGELPKEVENLELEIDEIKGKIDVLKGELEQLEEEIGRKKLTIKESEAQIKKYNEQLKNVKNNREYEALSKEVEYQNLEIELANKRINEFKVRIDNKQEFLDIAEEKLKERNEDLKVKKGELDTIITANEKEEKALIKLSDDYGKNIEERLLTAYKRIRDNANNGLAVVPVIDGATMGSFFIVPPQRELDIRQRKQIIFSEHCGRILVDKDLAGEEEEKMKGIFAKV
jgi:predicted  nucleic acid-binding Zn-ribbon protein